MGTIHRLIAAADAIEADLDRGVACELLAPGAIRRLTRAARLVQEGRLHEIDALAEIAVARAVVALGQPLPPPERLPLGVIQAAYRRRRLD